MDATRSSKGCGRAPFVPVHHPPANPAPVAEVGRHPELMQMVAQKTGANVIAVSGFFPERMGIPYWFRRQTVEELAEFHLFAGVERGRLRAEVGHGNLCLVKLAL